MAVLRIAIISLTILIYLAGARCHESNLSTSEDLVASINSTSNDRGFKMKHNWPTCPLWKYHKYHNSSCECGSGIHNVVICRDNQSTISIVSCYCMSYSDNGDGVVVGACPFLCGNYFHMNIDSVNNLNTLCDRDIRQNRQGQMCGKCKDNHSPSPYSYQLKCANCSHYKYNWLKYLAMAYAPLTVFFFVVIIFRFNALSASMNAIIFFSQLASSPAVMNAISIFAYFSNADPVDHDINLMSVANVVTIPFSIWNLDFFRMFYEPYCLHPNLSIIQIMCLDYAIAMYPLLLIFSIYTLFNLYERFEVARIFFKPVVWLFTRLNHQWNASTSLVEAFVTFILLSICKGDQHII